MKYEKIGLKKNFFLSQTVKTWQVGREKVKHIHTMQLTLYYAKHWYCSSCMVTRDLTSPW